MDLTPHNRPYTTKSICTDRARIWSQGTFVKNLLEKENKMSNLTIRQAVQACSSCRIAAITQPWSALAP